MDDEVRNLTVNVSKNSTLHRLEVNFVHVHAGKEVQTIEVLRIVRDLERTTSLVDNNNCLEEHSLTVLDVLTHGVEVCGVVNAGRENTSAVLTFGLTVELLPPFCHEVERRLVVDHDFCCVTAAEQAVSGDRVLVAVVLHFYLLEITACVTSTGHELTDVDTCNSDRQKTYSCQNGETSSDVIRYYECLVAFLSREALKSSLCLICCRIDSLSGFFFTVLFFHVSADDTESDRRLSCCTGLGDDVDGNSLTFEKIHQVSEICSADGVTAEKDHRSFSYFLLGNIRERMRQKLDRSSCAEVGTSDTDNQKYIRILSDLSGCFADTDKLVLVILARKLYPAKEVTAGTCLLVKHVVCHFYLWQHLFHFAFGNERHNVGSIKTNHKNSPHSFMKIGVLNTALSIT